MLRQKVDSKTGLLAKQGFALPSSAARIFDATGPAAEDDLSRRLRVF